MTLRSTRGLEVKTAVYDALKASPDLATADASVFFGLPPKDDPSDTYVIVGPLKWTGSEWITNRGRKEDFRIEIISEVQILAGTPVDAETKVAALNAAVEDFFANSPTFDLGNLVISNYSPGELSSWPMDQNVYAGQVRGEVTVEARF